MSKSKLWTKSKTIELIEHYRNHECLWNLKSQLYKNNTLKMKAFIAMSNYFKFSETELKAKIKNLRTTYSQERKKVIDSQKSGAATDEIYESRLFYFEELRFLDPYIVFRTSKSNAPVENLENNETEIPDQVFNKENMPSTEPPELFSPDRVKNCLGNSEVNSNEQITVRTLTEEKKNKRTKNKNNQEKSKFDVALESLISANVNNDSTEDEFSTFGKSIAFQLRKLPEILAIEAMSEIQRVSMNYRLKSFASEHQISQNLNSVTSVINVNKLTSRTSTNSKPKPQIEIGSKFKKKMPNPYSKVSKNNNHSITPTSIYSSQNAYEFEEPTESDKNEFEFSDFAEPSNEILNESSSSESSHISFAVDFSDEDETLDNPANKSTYNTNTILDKALFDGIYDETENNLD